MIFNVCTENMDINLFKIGCDREKLSDQLKNRLSVELLIRAYQSARGALLNASAKNKSAKVDCAKEYAYDLNTKANRLARIVKALSARVEL